MPAQSESKPAHIQRLDLLRALAILMVFCFHGLGASMGVIDLPWIGNFHDFSAAPSTAYLRFYLFSFGKLGVPLFFVISGFCIHLSFLKAVGAGKTADFIPKFYFRRFWRIYPVYFVALAVFSVLSISGTFGFKEAKMIAIHAALLHNLNDGHFYAINPAFWSIAVEWQLYMVYPLVILCRRWVGATAAFITLIVLGYLDRYYFPGFIANGEWRFAVSQLPFAYWPQWLIGAWIAERWVAQRPAIPFLRLFIYTSIVAFLVASQYLPAFRWAFDVAAILFALLLEAFIRDPRPLNAFERLFVPIGLCSYSIYLFHNLIFDLLPWIHRHCYSPQPYIDLSITLCILFLLILGPCWLSYRYIELGSIRLGDILWRRVRRGRTGSLPETAAYLPANDRVTEPGS